MYVYIYIYIYMHVHITCLQYIYVYMHVYITCLQYTKTQRTCMYIYTYACIHHILTIHRNAENNDYKPKRPHNKSNKTQLSPPLNFRASRFQQHYFFHHFFSKRLFVPGVATISRPDTFCFFGKSPIKVGLFYERHVQ